MSKKTEDKILHLFKLQYMWYEGEYDSTIFATTKEKEEIEKDLKEAASSIKINRKKENAVDRLPEAYKRIIDILRQKGYVVCYFLSDPNYYVYKRGLVKGTKIGKYEIIHLIEKTERKKLI